MNKSIYEEVLKIIDRNMFALPDGFAVLYEIRKKILEAQKQEKLLDLYKQLVNENLQINLSVLEKIKELENE